MGVSGRKKNKKDWETFGDLAGEENNNNSLSSGVPFRAPLCFAGCLAGCFACSSVGV